MDEVLILVGSARRDGLTAAAVTALGRELGLADRHVVDLGSCRIEPFQYESSSADDFQTVVGAMLRHRQIIFATPVYWYAMSGVMKMFFDRLTDLLSEERQSLGRALAGRNVWLLATGTDDEIPDGFAVPFQRTADYFGMAWKAAFYMKIDDRAQTDAQDFSAIRDMAAALAAEARTAFEYPLSSSGP